MVDIYGEICRKTGAHVAIIHHSGKNTEKGMRGSNALPGGVDASLKVTKGEAGKPSNIEVEFAKDDAAGDILPFRLRVVELGKDEDGDAITTLILDESDDDVAARKPPLSSGAKSALDQLRNAIITSGEPHLGSDHVPHGRKTVSVERWRADCYAANAADTSAEAKRKAFHRALQSLQEKGLIATWEGQVWLRE
jgi:hypothetical protein